MTRLAIYPGATLPNRFDWPNSRAGLVVRAARASDSLRPRLILRERFF